MRAPPKNRDRTSIPNRIAPEPDPYSLASADYATRNRTTETEVLPGLVRVDVGGPA